MSPPSALKAAQRLLLHEFLDEVLRGALAAARFDFVQSAVSAERAERLLKGAAYFTERLRGAA